MTRRWQRLTLHEAGISLIDCEHRTPPASAAGYPYIAIPQIQHGRLDLSDVRRITFDDYVEWTRKAKPQAHDVVLSRRCNPGETAFVPEGLECALGQNLVLLRTDGTKVSPQFLRWLVRGPAWWDQVSKFMNVGAIFDSLKCADVPNFELPIPPAAQQRAIVDILGTLDDKIELNRKMNETLEQMARALFKSWFVDFDPVHAKAAGRHPAGMDAETAKLFPSEFQDSELGKIPKGWTRSRLDNWVSILSGGTPSKSDASLWSGSIPWISPKTMSSIHVTDADDRVAAAAIGNGTRIAPAGSTLVMVRGMGLHREVRISQARRDVTFNQDVKALVPKGIHASLLLFAMLNMQSELLGRVESSGHGTGKLPTERLLGCEITLPSIEVQARLARIFDQANDLFAANELAARTLACVRDDLLPRLLSGEIDIASADRCLGASTSLV